MNPKIYLAIPVLNESENLPLLVDYLLQQEMNDFEVVFCVNNYEAWWHSDHLVDQCYDNHKSIKYLEATAGLKITVIDKSSENHGWPAKKGGVGWARKVAMDHIAERAGEEDIIVSMDADTFYPPDYLLKLMDDFQADKDLAALSIPYYHRLEKPETMPLILRYELYMRYYLLNMLRIKNPYAFTALGSAMANTVWAYRKIGGLTPVKSGEDFYFLQKLIKNTKVSIWSEALAYPSSRFSDRVLFGTGPALIKGNNKDWNSYPFYHPQMFDAIGSTFRSFPELFKQHRSTPMDAFLSHAFKEADIWEALRQNYKDLKNFIRACQNKVDGLRILQFLKKNHPENSIDHQVLADYIVKMYPDELSTELLHSLSLLDFEKPDIESLKVIRDFLFKKEMEARYDLHGNVVK